MNAYAQQLGDTIVARATPAGEGAIGIIRLSGKDSIAIADTVFYGKKLANQSSHTIHFGTIRSSKDDILDEVLVSIFRAPNSYTGEDVVEISFHGSSYILQSALQLFVEKGARPANPGEYTLRAFLNGKLDLSQAEAVGDLIASQSKAAHDIAINQMRGGFSSEIKRLRQQLIDFASMIELELDFSEEDVEFANRKALKNLVLEIKKLINRLIESYKLGNVIKNGVSTVIAGRPNAGKSTLLNALLNEDRAIVSEIAGTTRDTIEEILNINGIHFRIIDTAGIREAQDTIEAVGVERTFEKIRQSALLIYIFDSATLSTEEVLADLKKLIHKGLPTLVIANKIDLSGVNTFTLDGYQVISISAKNNENIPVIRQALYDLVVAEKLNSEATTITSARHYEALMQANHSLSEVIKGLENNISGDLLAMDIRRALMFFGEITGEEITADDLLGNIFGKFCIGK